MTGPENLCVTGEIPVKVCEYFRTMKRIKHKGLNGKTIIELVPENDADREEIRRKIESGELDDGDSFGDDPEAWGFPPDAADAV